MLNGEAAVTPASFPVPACRISWPWLWSAPRDTMCAIRRPGSSSSSSVHATFASSWIRVWHSRAQCPNLLQ